MIEANFGRVRRSKPELSAIIPAGGFQNIENKVRVRLVSGAAGVTALAIAEDSVRTASG